MVCSKKGEEIMKLRSSMRGLVGLATLGSGLLATMEINAMSAVECRKLRQSGRTCDEPKPAPAPIARPQPPITPPQPPVPPPPQPPVKPECNDLQNIASQINLGASENAPYVIRASGIVFGPYQVGTFGVDNKGYDVQYYSFIAGDKERHKADLTAAFNQLKNNVAKAKAPFNVNDLNAKLKEIEDSYFKSWNSAQDNSSTLATDVRNTVVNTIASNGKTLADWSGGFTPADYNKFMHELNSSSIPNLATLKTALADKFNNGGIDKLRAWVEATIKLPLYVRSFADVNLKQNCSPASNETRDFCDMIGADVVNLVGKALAPLSNNSNFNVMINMLLINGNTIPPYYENFAVQYAKAGPPPVPSEQDRYTFSLTQGLITSGFCTGTVNPPGPRRRDQ